MKKALHIAKSNTIKQKSATLTLFLILTIVSAFCTIGVSILSGVTKDYEASIERLNGLHSMFIMSNETYLPEYEEIFKNDPQVSEYNIGEVIYQHQLPLYYGGDIRHQAIILNVDAGFTISAPLLIDADDLIPLERAVYLPLYAKQNLGFETGDSFIITHRNKPIELVIAGFFEATEFGATNGVALKFFVADLCFKQLKQELGSSVWISVRFQDPYYSTAFNAAFLEQMDIDVHSFGKESMITDILASSENSILPIMIITAIIIVFALIIVLISIIVIRFRVTNNIDDAIHKIGVLKASGYTSKQIIFSYLMEYLILSLPASVMGILLAVPVFSVVRQMMFSITGVTWTLRANILYGLLLAVLMNIVLLMMVWLSCRKIQKMPPVDALRGGIATNSFRHNYFPLTKGFGNVIFRLGLKNMFVYLRQYFMIGTILAGATLTIIFVATLFHNFTISNTALIRMTGIEIADVDLIVARHTDANALAAELELLPEIRATSMLSNIEFSVDGVDMMGFCSNDFSRLETIATHEGRYPRYENEVAITKRFADQLGKRIGDNVIVKVGSVSQEYIICGFFSGSNNGGRVGMLTLEGYQRLDINYHRDNIKIYLNKDVSFDEFAEIIKEKYGVVNIYRPKEDDSFIAAKKRAEAKIANYLHYYGIDSIEYAVIYNDEIILSGSSSRYQIEEIIDYRAWLNVQIGTYGSVISILTLVVSLVSLIIVSLILSMTVRQIIQKRRSELGVMKSGGYTTKQLARQLAISFLPCALTGITVGCVGGALMVNPAVTAMFSATGVYNANVHISLPATIVIGLLTLLFTFMVTHISAMRIKNITVYELLSE